MGYESGQGRGYAEEENHERPTKEDLEKNLLTFLKQSLRPIRGFATADSNMSPPEFFELLCSNGIAFQSG
jgi:hypothetical protein